MPIFCFKMVISSYSCSQNDPKDNIFWMMYLETPHPITLLKINSHAQNLACWFPRAFPIIPNLFHIFFHIPSPGGTPKNDPLEDVTKFGMKSMSKLSPTESIFITERLNFYLNFLRTSLNLGKKLHLSICLRFYGITGQMRLSLGVFSKNIAMIITVHTPTP